MESRIEEIRKNLGKLNEKYSDYKKELFKINFNEFRKKYGLNEDDIKVCFNDEIYGNTNVCITHVLEKIKSDLGLPCTVSNGKIPNKIIEYRRITKNIKEATIYKDIGKMKPIFFKTIENELSSLHKDMQKGDKIIYYFNKNEFKHVGIIIEANKVDSKYGNGPIYEHGTLLVPWEYGEIIRYSNVNKYYEIVKKSIEIM